MRTLNKNEQCVVICKRDVGHPEGRIHGHNVGSIITFTGGNSYKGEVGSQHVGRHQVIAVNDLVYKQDMVGKVTTICSNGDIRIQWKPDSNIIRHNVLNADGTVKWHHAPEGLKQGDKLDSLKEDGERVMVLDSNGSPVSVGDLVTSSEGGDNYLDSDGDSWIFPRDLVLAIGDKVTRGPGWSYADQDYDLDSNGQQSEGEVVKFTSSQTHMIWVRFPHHEGGFKPKDLRPVGDSEEVKAEDDKPECFGKYPCRLHPACTACPSHGASEHGNCRCNSCNCQHHDCKPVDVVKPMIGLGSDIEHGTRPECFGENNCPDGLSTSDCHKCYKAIAQGLCSCKQCSIEKECNNLWDDNGQPSIPNKPKEAHKMNDSIQETFDRLERANQIKLVDQPKAENKIKAAQEEELLLKEEMARLLLYPTLYSEKVGIIQDCASSDPAVAAKATIRALELGMPVNINVTAPANS